MSTPLERDQAPVSQQPKRIEDLVPMTGEKALLTRREAAEYLRRSPRGFDRLRLPRVVIDRRPLFLKSDLDQFIQKKRHEPSAAPTAAPRLRRKTTPAPMIDSAFDFETWLRRQKAELVEQRDGTVKVRPT